MAVTEIPSGTELAQRAAALVTPLRERAPWAEENRRLHEETIEAMADAGVFRLRVPARYGGYEATTRTLLDVAAHLGRGDGSAAWTASVWWIPAWMVCQFPDEVQDEVFSTPDVRVCGTLSPGGMATSADGGIVVSGRWGFISGALHSHWQQIIAVVPSETGEMCPVLALVPMADLQIVDDWHTSGLRGTGSVSTVADGVFVPRARVLPLEALLSGQGVSAANAGSPVYRGPLLPVASATSVGTVLGLAEAAREAFFERLPDRKITYTTYDSQREAALTHLEVAEARLKADEAGFHARRLTDLVDGKGASGEAWSVDDRVRARAWLGRATHLGRESVDVLAGASGGSSIYQSAPIQRIQRDAHALTLHALMHPSTNFELYGRALCSMEPNTLYI
ncbi:acyl-CoA dehydrogenase family protein [Actinomadura fibrosa]|uniref:Acyl-CoA dehydrogenase family protein n=1 Tax=Actinomadura fibrosa TaxID=111802 RepID=A0ABW2Y3H1_9ACTN|nr:acyl-CoA dehydrogenase family protein [Actinomadura fibrosa]